MSDYIQSYLFDVILSLLVIFGALTLYLLSKKYFKLSAVKKSHFKVILVLMVILVITLFIEIWQDKSNYIEDLALYKKFLPGYETVILVIVMAIISHFLQLWLLRKGISTEVELSKRHKIRLIAKWGSWGFFILSTIIILLLQRGWNNVGTFLGLIGAGIALSLQESVLCLLGWLYIIFSHAYDIGDRIEVDNRIGDVIGITPTHTRLLEISMKIQGGQSTGRILTIPNSLVFRNSVYNATSGFPYIWVEISTVVTFESDWEKASEIILNVSLENTLQIEPEVKKNITQMQDEYAIHYQYLSPKVYTTIEGCGINLTLRFLSPVRSCRQREHDISIAILTALKSHPEIELAYPTSRVYRRNEELTQHDKDDAKK